MLARSKVQLKMVYRFLHIKKAFLFGSEENDPIYVVIMLCALSGDEHINMITAHGGHFFSDDERLSALLKASSMTKIQAVING